MEFLRPKQVAAALGVSESSLKRWCNQGLIPTAKTAGGHRRIPLDGVLRYVRQSRRPLARPELLGLPQELGKPAPLEEMLTELHDGLLEADAEKVKSVLMRAYLSGQSFGVLGDQLLAPAFESIGDLWQCGQLEVFQERRACEICLQALRELRWEHRADADGPLAIGGAPSGDNYTLANLLVELVLQDGGWRVEPLGRDVPLNSLAAAVLSRRPEMFWLSVSHIADAETFVAQYHDFYETAGQQTAVVVGGRALTDDIRKRMKFAAYCDNLQQLEAFARALHLKARRAGGNANGR